MCAQAVLVALLVFTSTVQADKDKEGKVEFWRKKVTLTCPWDATWHDESGGGKIIANGTTHTLEYKQAINYNCVSTNKEKTKYKFYVKGKTCENCFELDALTFLMVIIIDVVGTAFLMIIIFKCTNKKNQDPAASKRSTSSGSVPPATPSPDYAPLNPRTRAMDTYSTVVNRMG